MTVASAPMLSRRLWDLKVPMRDGVNLSADVYLPKDDPDRTAFPVLLARSPYNNGPRFPAQANWFSEQGYAVVLQDVRGRDESEGRWYPFHQEGPDGCDSIDWIAAQPWCDGNVGMFGGAYAGWAQWAAARERPPALKAMVSASAPGRWMRGVPFRDGLVSLVTFSALNMLAARTLHDGFSIDWEYVLWHLPLRTMDSALGREMPVWQDWLDHPTLDEYWSSILLTADDFSRIDLPVLHLTGWYDIDQPGTLFFYQGMTAHSPAADKQHLAIGPWDQAGVQDPRQKIAEQDFGEAAVWKMNDIHKAWFDRWLRDPADSEAKTDEARCRYFVTGCNQWAESNAWPPPGTRVESFHLDSGEGAPTAAGDRRLLAALPAADGTNSYHYDPSDPVISTVDWDFGGGAAHLGKRPMDTPFDRRPVEARPDVLVYTGALLETPLRVHGQPVLILHASSDGPDTDWVVHVSDVHPDGASMDLASGVLRARFRESLSREELLTPGQVYEFRIELGHVGHEFAAGHSIRASITSSEFPHYDRNPNTGHSIGADAEVRVGHNTVHHGPSYPSRLQLPIAASDDSPASAQA